MIQRDLYATRPVLKYAQPVDHALNTDFMFHRGAATAAPAVYFLEGGGGEVRFLSKPVSLPVMCSNARQQQEIDDGGGTFSLTATTPNQENKHCKFYGAENP